MTDTDDVIYLDGAGRRIDPCPCCGLPETECVPAETSAILGVPPLGGEAGR